MFVLGKLIPASSGLKLEQLYAPETTIEEQ